MKKLLLASLLIISFGVSEYHATEVEVSKQEMMRETPASTGPIDSPVVDMEEPVESRPSTLAILGVTVVIVTIVGVSSIFITKFALSLRGNEEDIYIKKSNEKNQDD